MQGGTNFSKEFETTIIKLTTFISVMLTILVIFTLFNFISTNSTLKTMKTKINLELDKITKTTEIDYE